MASSDRWRLTALRTVGSDGLELSGLELFQGAARVDASATLTATLAPTTGTLAALQDGSLTTVAGWPANAVRQPGFSLEWAFPAPVSVSHIVPSSGSSSARWLESARMEYWDGAAWAGASTLGAFPWPGASQPAVAGSDPMQAQVAARIQALGGAIVDTGPAGVAFTQKGAVSVVSVGGTDWLNFPGGAGNYLQLAASAALDIGAGDYTIEGIDIIPSAALNGVLPLFSAPMEGAGVSVYASVSDAGLRVYDSASQLLGASSAPTPGDTPFHWCVERKQGQVKLYLNGAVVASWADARAYTSPLVYTVGYDGYWAPFAHRAQAVLVTKAARYNGPFTPPTALPGTTPMRYEQEALRTRAATAASPIDLEFGGTGTLEIDTSIKGNPNNTPTRARVSILRQRDKALARVAWSDADGKLSVPGLDLKNQQFIALAEYPGNPADPTAEGYMRPVAGVSKLEPT